MNEPRPTDPPDLPTDWGFDAIWPARDLCKHGRRWRCERCGTGERRDAGHRTRGGRGAVARLR